MIKRKTYLTSDKSSRCWEGESFGLKDKALDKYVYTLTEVELDILVNKKTGELWITGVNGVELKEPVKG